MSDLLIEKSKKVEWLKRYGTEDALELLGVQVEDLHNKAVQSRLLSKEIQTMEDNQVIDPLGGLTEVTTAKIEDGLTDLSGLVETKELQSQAQTPVVQAATVSTPEVVVKDADKTEAPVDTRELVDALINEVVNPMIDEIKAVREEMANDRAEKAKQTETIEALQKQLSTLQKELQVQGLQIQEETLPQASAVALVKSYIQERMSGNTNGTFGKSLDKTDNILTLKPAENKVELVKQAGTFSGFVDGN